MIICLNIEVASKCINSSLVFHQHVGTTTTEVCQVLRQSRHNSAKLIPERWCQALNDQGSILTRHQYSTCIQSTEIPLNELANQRSCDNHKSAVGTIWPEPDEKSPLGNNHPQED
jgi:hypothetical protein